MGLFSSIKSKHQIFLDKTISPRSSSIRSNPFFPEPPSLLSFFFLSPHPPNIEALDMASPALITPTPKPRLNRIKPKLTTTTITATSVTAPTPPAFNTATGLSRRHLNITSLAVTILSPALLSPAARAASDEEYVKETEEVIKKVRSTITLDRNDPNVADAVADLRAASNSWVAKYRREKALLGRSSFRDMYSALNAVSGHYISFGPAAPIPAKRKARILEEMDTAEKALSRGR